MWCEHSPLTLAQVQIPSRRRDMWVEFVAGSFPCFGSCFFFFFQVLYCTVMQLGIVDEEPFCGCAASKLFIYLFIYLW